MTSKRVSIPLDVQLAVLVEAGYRCAVPTCHTILAIDLHHMEYVSEDGKNEVSNLLALCPTCHRLHYKGVIPKEAIRIYKGMLVALSQAFDKDSIDNLLFLYKTEGEPLMLSGDGVLQFKHVVAAGLAAYRSSVYYGPYEPEPLRYFSVNSSGNISPPPKPVPRVVYTVTLTRKGRMLVEAWMKGNRAALERALAAEDVAEDDEDTTLAQSSGEGEN